MRRFGELRRYAEGALLARVGQVSPGVCVVLAGAIESCGMTKPAVPCPWSRICLVPSVEAGRKRPFSEKAAVAADMLGRLSVTDAVEKGFSGR